MKIKLYYHAAMFAISGAILTVVWLWNDGHATKFEELEKDHE